ncbi:HAMP domain-containing methyl-accepting chemotaxis protein [Paenibacillus sp. RC67]|uniref:methyl-accepting chemotaxis protein n=1 Tax=Paenibacillus sp. RC67 TaxID=3039392 RepID=UPI0024AD58CC|nr:HAMP domain-containing methyl-accepting chemotaxis protein [Paenibacillus sp. RC67]
MRMTIGKKLMISYAVILLIMGVMGTLDLISMRILQNNTRQITQNWLVGTQVANQVNFAKEHISVLYYQMIAEPNAAKKVELNNQITETFADIDQGLTAYESSVADEQDRANLNQLKIKWNQFKDLNTRQKAGGKGMEEASAEVSKAFQDVQDSISVIVSYNKKGADQAQQDSEELYRRSIIEFAVLIVLAFVVVAVIGYLVTRIISRPMVEASQALVRISQGDLTGKQLASKSKDELGTLITAVNTVSHSLKESVLQMQETSHLVAASAQQLSASSEENAAASEHVTQSIQDVASGSENQAQSAMECARAMDEMAVGVQRIAESTSEISEITIEASQQAEQGTTVLQDASAKIHSISKAVGKTGEVIRKLEEQSHSINRISLFIGDIARQTNLLSLNAAIEAARAGEHGRGFAVVADEIRKLATQTADSIEEINRVIDGIREGTGQAVLSMDEGMVEVEGGLQAMSQAEETFSWIVNSSIEISRRVQEAAAAAQQMSASTEEVTATITSMGHIAEQTSGLAQTVAATTEQQLASIQEITSSATTLSGISEDLHQLVIKFRVE